MHGYPQFFDLIDTRSFSSLWYWIGLAAAWGVASCRPLGVPFDMVQRARLEGGTAMSELESVARPLASRLVSAMDRGGVWVVALGSTIYTVLALLGFSYGVELAQAVLIFALPLSLAAVATVGAAHRIIRDRVEVVRQLRRLRRMIQAIGLVAIFFAALWGMYVNLGRSVV